MADDTSRNGGKTTPVRSGKLGRPRRVTSEDRARMERRPDPRELDRRQERFREVRRRGPTLPAGTSLERVTDRADVPPTECDEPGGDE